MTSAWVLLLVAAVLEIAFAISLKNTEGFTRLFPTILTIAIMIAAVYTLSKTLTTLPVGTAYAAWTGIGAVGTVVFGMAVLDDPISAPRIAFIGLIIVGAVGLSLVEA